MSKKMDIFPNLGTSVISLKKDILITQKKQTR